MVNHWKRSDEELHGNLELITGEEEQIVEKLRANLRVANNMASLKSRRTTLYEKTIKRLIDIIASLSAIIVLSPIMFLAAIGTHIFHGSPIIFRQTRMGKDMRPFEMYKFKSLVDKRGEDGKMLPVDQRVTKFGKFLRATSIDELPNFVNVLKGEMSIIGPRPVPVFYVDRMSKRHKHRFEVKPGLECPAQYTPCLFGGDEDDYQFHIKYENDVWYVEHIGFHTDMKKALSLFKLAFSKKERVAHAVAGTNFVGYDKLGRAISLRIAKKFPENT